MMDVILTFFVAFLFSFIGTIPPGTLSLSIIQLGLNERMAAAWRMALAAAMIEYPYAWVAVEFHHFIIQSVNVTHSLHLVSAIVMILLGALNLWSSSRSTKFTQRFEGSGFRKGVILSVLNPLAIPFWIAMTAYLKAYGWIDLSSKMEIHAYLLGVSAGTLVLFMLLAYLARKVVTHFNANNFLRKIPGVVLILLGIYSFSEYMLG
jgi:threonine/homoserine/homoserine lactone efflux protein